MRLRGLKRNNGHHLSAICGSIFLLWLSPMPLLAFSGYVLVYEMKDQFGNNLSPDEFTKARLSRAFKITSVNDPEAAGSRVSYQLRQVPTTSSPQHPTYQQTDGHLKVRTVELKKSTNTMSESKPSTKQKKIAAKKKEGKSKDKSKSESKHSKNKASQASSSQTRTCIHPINNLPPLYNLDVTDTQPKTVGFQQISGTRNYALTLDGFPTYAFESGIEKEFSSRPDTFINTWMSLERRFSRYGVENKGVMVSTFTEQEISSGAAMQRMLWEAGFNDIVMGLTCEFRIQLLLVGEQGTENYSMTGIHATQILPQQDTASPSPPAANLLMQFVPEEHFGSTTITAGGDLTHQPAEADVDGEWDTNEPVTPLTHSSSWGSSRSRHIEPYAEVSLSDASGRSTPNSQPPSVHGGSPVTPLSQSTPPAAANYHSPSSHPRSWSVSQQVPRSSPNPGNHQTSRSWGSRVSPSQSPHQPFPVSGTPPRGRSGSSGPYQQINIAGLNPVSSGAYQTVNRQGGSARRFAIVDEPQTDHTTGQVIAGQSMSYQNVAPLRSQEPVNSYENVTPAPPVPPRPRNVQQLPPKPSAPQSEKDKYEEQVKWDREIYRRQKEEFDYLTGKFTSKNDTNDDSDEKHSEMEANANYPKWSWDRDRFDDGGGGSAAGATIGSASF